METHLNIKSLPSPCFDKEEFLKKTFSADKFVSHCRKYATLEMMKEDLSMYHKMLCAAMIELINKDYADIVNLSSNLVGLDNFINSLTSPLQTLKNEVDKIKHSLNVSFETATRLYSERNMNYKMKILSNHVFCFIEGLKKVEQLNPSIEYHELALELENLERISFNFNVVKFHVQKLSSFKEFSYQVEVVNYVHECIQVRLQKTFLKSLPCTDVQYLTKVLGISRIISAERKIEECFIHFAIRPFMQCAITQTNITKHGLRKVYEDILTSIRILCRNLLPTFASGTNIKKDTSSTNRQTAAFISGYDFLLNAVWPEIVDSFKYIAAEHKHSLGDPEQFVENYSASMVFLEKFESYLLIQGNVDRFHKLSSYKEFLAQWNLDVYFEIRFQEIVRRFEESLVDENVTKSDEECNFMLNASCILYSSISVCWEKTVLLDPLKSNFLKLSLQLISRYVKWANSVLRRINNAESCLLISMLICDVEHLFCEINILFHKRIYPEILSGMLSFSIDDVEEIFYDTLKHLYEIIPAARRLLFQLLISRSSEILRNILTIPQKFRKTNQKVPDKPSSYLTNLLIPLTTFLTDTSSILNAQYINDIKQEVAYGIIKECTTTMREVLISIRKMEQSLRNLRRARDRPPAGDQLPVVATVVTDDDKIRKQLAIDVDHLRFLMKEELHLNGSEMQSYIELKELINSAEKDLPL